MKRGSPAATTANALSFLDIVTAGFGGTVFLFIVFASLPIDTRALVPGGGERFIDVSVRWPRSQIVCTPDSWNDIDDTSKYYCGDQHMWSNIVDLHIRHDSPDGRNYRTRLSALAQRIDPRNDSASSTADMPWGSIHITGFDPFGRYRTSGEAKEQNLTHLRVLDPRGGRWEFKAKLYAIGGFEREEKQTDKSIEVTVTIRCTDRRNSYANLYKRVLNIQATKYEPVNIKGPPCEFEVRK